MRAHAYIVTSCKRSPEILRKPHELQFVLPQFFPYGRPLDSGTGRVELVEPVELVVGPVGPIGPVRTLDWLN